MDGRIGTTGYDMKDAVRGTVRFFDDSLGYGKIDSEHVPGNVAFVHWSDIISKEKRRRLVDGQEVEFVPAYTAKGWRALGVRVLTEEELKAKRIANANKREPE